MQLRGRWSTYRPLLAIDEHVCDFDIQPNGAVWLGICRVQNGRLLSVLGLMLLNPDSWDRYDLLNFGVDPQVGIFRGMSCAANNRLWFLLDYRLCMFDGESMHILTPGTHGMPPELGFEPRLVADRQGGVWLSMQKYGAAYYREGEWRVFNRRNTVLDGFVTSITIDKTDKVWLATRANRNVSIFTYDGVNWERVVRISPQHAREEVGSMLVDDERNLWIGWKHHMRDSRSGLWMLDSDCKIHMIFTKRNSNLTTTDMGTMTTDQQGRLWVAGYGVTIFENGSSRCWITIQPDQIAKPGSRARELRISTSGDQLAMTFLGGNPKMDNMGRIWMLAKGGIAEFEEIPPQQ
jgi:hypothetical protein